MKIQTAINLILSVAMITSFHTRNSLSNFGPIRAKIGYATGEDEFSSYGSPPIGKDERFFGYGNSAFDHGGWENAGSYRSPWMENVGDYGSQNWRSAGSYVSGNPSMEPAGFGGANYGAQDSGFPLMNSYNTPTGLPTPVGYDQRFSANGGLNHNSGFGMS